MVVCILTVCGALAAAAASASRNNCVLGLVNATGAPATGLVWAAAGVTAEGGVGLAGVGLATGGVACVIIAGLAIGAIFEVAFSETFCSDCVMSPASVVSGPPVGIFAVVAAGAAAAGVAGETFMAPAGTGGTEPVGGFGTLICTTCIGRVTFKLLGAGIARVGVNVCLTVTAGFAAPPVPPAPAPGRGGRLIRSVSFFISFNTPVLGFFAPLGSGGMTGEAGMGEVLRFNGPGEPGGGGCGASAIPKCKPNLP